MPRKHPKKEKAQRETNKGWAEGAREDFLNQYVDDFARAMGQGASAEDEVLRNVVRRYFFHFDIDDNVEPTLPLKPFDELWVPQQDDGPFEELRKKRDLREKKKKVSCGQYTPHIVRLTVLIGYPGLVVISSVEVDFHSLDRPSSSPQ